MKFNLTGSMRWTTSSADPDHSRIINEEVEAKLVSQARQKAESIMNRLYNEHKPDYISATLVQVICTFTRRPARAARPAIAAQQAFWENSADFS